MAGRLYRMAKVVSANPASWGIIDANQISGFRTVAKLTDLYSIAACILSSAYGDGTTTGADAVGQIWHVQEDNSDYRLINWAGRGKAEGWEKVPTASEIFTAFDDEITPVIQGLNEKDKTLENSINSLQSKVDENKSQIDINTQNIFWVNSHFGKPEGFATLDTEGFVPLSQLGHLDTTLFEYVDELPSTIDTIKKHIYLTTAGTTGDKNNYAEYIYTGDLTATYDATKWEKLGEVTASVDLSGYYTKTDADKKIASEINKHRIESIRFVPATDGTDNLQLKLNEYQGEKVGPTTIPAVTTNTNGLMSPTLLTKLNGIANGANNYTHPAHTAHTSGLYKITVDDLGHVSATANVEKGDITKLGIPGAIPALTAAVTMTADTNTISLAHGSSSPTATLKTATSKEAGLCSAAMWSKLNSINVADTPLYGSSDLVTGDGIINAIDSHIVNEDNLDALDTSKIETYTIPGVNNTDTRLTQLTDSLVYTFDQTGHSVLRIDNRAVLTDADVTAISNDELTKILV